MTATKKKQILIVDDERGFYSKLKHTLNKEFSFRHTTDPNNIAHLIRLNMDQLAAVLLDLNFQNKGYKTGLYEILPQTHRIIKGQIPIIVCTSNDEADTERIAKEKGATLLLRKTVDYLATDWKQQIKQTIGDFSEPEGKEHWPPFTISDGFIAVTPKMQTLKEDLSMLPQFLPNASVLFLGDTGVGKEVAAKFLHQSKCQIKGDLPFVALNLSTISEDLISSELFGHKKGAFTGAINDKEGMFKKAGKGTLFLDEIGEVSLDVQVKLLRVLEEKKFRPVGDDQAIELEAQVVFSTNKDLQKEMEIGNFRQDFYERISAYVYHIPALKHRIAEIAPLLDHFLRQPDICPPNFRFFGKSAEESFSPEALEKLCQYHWPGNIRELRNTLQKTLFAAFKTRKEKIDLSLLPDRFRHMPSPALEGTSSPKISQVQQKAPEIIQWPLDKQTAYLELKNAEQALINSGGRKNDAAQLLGMKNDQTLRYKIKKHYSEHEELFSFFPTLKKVYKLK